MLSPTATLTNESLSSTLRLSTIDLHNQLDDLIRVDEITRSVADYRRYLLRFYYALSDCFDELSWSQLERMGLPDLDKRRRRYELLLSDLDFLSSTYKEHAGASFLKEPLLSQGSAKPARCAGILYVTEGSVHGSAMIAKELVRRITFQAEDIGLRFLQGHKENNGKMWRNFCAWLNELPREDKYSLEACDAARHSFELFILRYAQPLNLTD